MNYNGVEYYYILDIQGNVVGLMNQLGSVVVEYTYDAWGNIINQDSTVTGLDEINPYRYRGYRYDEETNLYYLQSRYYDPNMGRFINLDDVAYVSDETASSANLYSYAVNNPIMYVDYGGNYAAAITLSFIAGLTIGQIIVITIIIVLVSVAIYEGAMLIKEVAEKSTNQKSNKSVSEDSIPELPYDDIDVDDLGNSNLGEDGWVWNPGRGVWTHNEKGSIREHKKDETHGDYTPKGKSKKGARWRIYGNGTIENKWSKQRFPIPKNKIVNGE